ncbi:MAG: helix-turn-helix domain-containing protein [Thalassovita sp.]
MTNAFGQTLRTLRTDLSLSQLDLAHELGTTQRHLSFLETGRSKPSTEFVIRLATGLSLSLGQRAALFDASGFANPYRHQFFGDQDRAAVLDMLERRALRHWPFPGLILDQDWTVLRTNAGGKALLSDFGYTGNEQISLFEVFLSQPFQDRILNWEDLSMVFYFRMQAAAQRSSHIRHLLSLAKSAGRFDHLPQRLTSGDRAPPYIPAIIKGPNDITLSLTSFVGSLVATQDAAIEGLEVELMLPMDEATETCMLNTAPKI